MGRPLNANDIFNQAKNMAKAMGKPLFQAPRKPDNAPKPQPAAPVFEEGNYGVIELRLGELPEQVKPTKKRRLLVFNDGVIHRSVFDMFKYYSGRKGHEARA